jgi:ABC-type glycerol-3-phosphate transport system substrate-binding protein
MKRRETLKLAMLATGTGLAGCMGGGQSTTTTESGGGGDTTESGGGDENLPDGVMPQSEWGIDWNSPAPAKERLTGDDWTAPEITTDAIANAVSHTNSGGMQNDPATAFTNEQVQEKTGIEVTPIEVPSPRLKVKTLTPLSARSNSPTLFHINRSMYMDFVEPGWLQPLDDIWWDAEGVGDILPGNYAEDGGSYVTDLDSTMDGSHLYGSHWTAEGFFMHYRPDLLEELGFERNLFDGVNTDYDWSDCLEVWRAAKNELDKYGFVWIGGFPRHAVRWFFAHTLQQGGQIVQDDGKVVFDSKEALEALKFERLLLEEELAPNVLELGQGSATDVFLNGEALSFSYGGDVRNSAVERIGPEEEKVAMGLPPKADRGPDPWHATFTVEGLLVMNRFAPPEKKRAGAIVMDGNRVANANVEEFLQEGNIPVNTNAVEQIQDQTAYTHVLNEWAKTSIDPLWPRQLQTMNALASELQAAWGFEKSAEEALSQAQAAVNDILYQD